MKKNLIIYSWIGKMAGVLFLSFLIFSYPVKSEQTNNEAFVVHLDKAFYVCGEVIWYTIYTPQNMVSNPKTFKFIIANAEGDIVETHFLKTHGKKTISGYYKIPFSTSSGYYQLLLKGINEESKIPVTLFHAEVPIYNDLHPIDPSLLANSSEFMGLSDLDSVSNDLQIQLEMAKSSFHSNEKIGGSLQILDKEGNAISGQISISVVDKELSAFSDGPVVKASSVDENIDLNKLGDIVYVQGKVSTGGGDGVKANILGAYSTGENRVHFTQSNDVGTFTLTVPDFVGEKEIQFLSYQKEYENIETHLQEPDVPKISKPLVYNDFLIKYLELSQLRKKIFQYYTSVESNLNVAEIELDPIDLDPDHSYHIDNYERFDDMATLFKEILTPLRFRSEGGKYKASIYNPSARLASDRVFSGMPLFIIDGKITKDADYVARISMDEIERVDLFYNPQNLRKQFNVFGNSGVARIVTKVAEINLPENDRRNIYTIPGILPAAVPTQTAENTSDDATMPFFKPQVFWNPDLSVAKDGARIEFQHTDDQGEFVIHIVATSEDGQMGFAQFTYRVNNVN